MDQQSHIRDLLKPAAEAMGCDLWGVEYLPQGKHAILRVFIDKEDGVSVDDCEKVSRQISSVMDVEDPISSAYTLEVSSPGADRLLFEKEQYEAFTGARIKIRLRVNFDGRRNYTGILTTVEQDEVVVRVDDEEFIFPLESIDRAQIVPEFK